jgi:hypothetical protein
MTRDSEHLYLGLMIEAFACTQPRQVMRESFKRNVSRLKVFRGTNKTLLRSARAPNPTTFGMFPG